MPLGKPARPMPVPESVRDFLHNLLGKPVDVDKARKPIDLGAGTAAEVSSVAYRNDDGQIGGVCVVQLPLAASCGAALAMMPAPVAEDAVKAGELPENLAENFHEVANVLVQLLNGPAVAHLRTGELLAGAPDEVRSFIAGAAAERHFSVTIVGYPTGDLAFYAA